MLFLQSRTIGGHIFRKVGDHVPGGLHAVGAPGEAGGGGGIDPGGVVHEVGGEGSAFDLVGGEVPGELVDDGRHHLHVAQLLGADVGEQALGLTIEFKVTTK